ncbi:hypothetical protein Nepgr_007331 [Nepenthes gracilis]|uniref:TCP domain-containing protein n=1 Tax=Nepenthes gracilis TaxID=150966 RepID=A0AAD3XIE4_NEPGR|nr:hypothetical protein Nepgr_007331 [Nepenthes gracilis]
MGKIAEVKGGLFVRSTGRKDRHSKVPTSRGLRDRRVRLSANTAIQFYDVQDRLGYDRPSEAVDWLMEKAKASIHKLDAQPAAMNASCISSAHQLTPQALENGGQQIVSSSQHVINNVPETCSKDLHRALDKNPVNSTPSFISMDASNLVAVENYCSSEYKHGISNKSQNLCLYIQSHDILPQKAAENRLFPPTGSPEFGTMPSFSSDNQFQKIPTFNSKLDSGAGYDPLVFNSSPLLLRQQDFEGNDSYSRKPTLDFSSLHAAISPQLSAAADDFMKPNSYVPTQIQGVEQEHSGHGNFKSNSSSNLYQLGCSYFP